VTAARGDDTGSGGATTVVVLGTLDTKGREHAFLCERLRAAGVEPLVVDCGVLGEPELAPDVTAADVAAAAGHALADLRFAREGSDTRAVALEAMGRGAAVLVRRLWEAGRCDGVVGLGGSGGSTVIGAAMRALPVGVPKLLVSTLAAGDARAFVGTSDVCLMPSVTDIAGLNRVSRGILTNAAAAVAGMARGIAGSRGDGAPAAGRPPLVGLTMLGVTSPGVLATARALEARGFETIVFHAVGTGGATLEAMVAEGAIDAVIDFTPSEVTDELCGGIFSAGPERLTAAGRRGIPQVVVPGALDVINFGPADSVPARFADRDVVVHNPSVCAVRTTPEEAAHVAGTLVRRLAAGAGPRAVVVPAGALSRYDEAGGPFADPAVGDAVRAVLHRAASGGVAVHTVPAGVNDEAFSAAVVRVFAGLWQARQG